MGMRRFCAGAILCVTSVTVSAQNMTLVDEYQKRISAQSSIAALEKDVFGDRIDLSSGALEVVQTDLEIKGSGDLSLRVGRRFVSGEISAFGGSKHFGLWELDVPHLKGTFARAMRWTVRGSALNKYKRCSMFGPPPAVILMGGIFDAEEYWHGNFMYLPGSGVQEILVSRA